MQQLQELVLKNAWGPHDVALFSMVADCAFQWEWAIEPKWSSVSGARMLDANRHVFAP